MTNKANNKKEMSKKEQKDTKGGRSRPPLTAPGRKKVSWKSHENAPEWSDQAAKDIGHDVEKID